MQKEIEEELNEICGSETESAPESCSSFEEIRKRPHHAKATPFDILPSKFEIPKLYWLSSQTDIIEFKDVSPDIMEEPYQLFIYIYDKSLEYLANGTREKHEFSATVNQRTSSSDTLTITYRTITDNEVKAYCGAVMLMDIYKLAQLEWYWGRRNSIIRITQITDAFKWERFQDIRNVVSVSDVNKLNHLMCNQISTIFHSSPHLAVDEQLRKFDGRSSHKVVNKSKPAGAGMNAFILADGVAKCPLWYSTEGIGSTGFVVPSGPGLMNKNSARVLSFVQPYRQHQVSVYVDNLYTTHMLHKEMTAAYCILIGTVRFQLLPSVLKPKFTAFKNIRRTEGEMSLAINVPVIHLVHETYKYDGVYYIFIKVSSINIGQW